MDNKAPPPPALPIPPARPATLSQPTAPTRSTAPSQPAALARSTPWNGWHNVGLLLVIVAIALLGWLVPDQARQYAYVAILVLLGVFLVIVGHGIIGEWWGVLIDDRNKISLSRLQMALWTILVLGSFFIIALGNIKVRATNPLAIAIPETLWLLMGISTVSLIGSPLIKATHRTKQPDMAEEASTFNLLADQGVNAAKLDTRGLIVTNDSPAQASWSDLFRGEETGNAAHLDLAKIQMFYFTLILVLTYGVALISYLARPGAIQGFPAFDPGMMAVIAISHAGYLASKSIQHSTVA